VYLIVAMLSRASRVIYVHTSGVAAFTLPSATTRSTFAPSHSPLAFHLRQHLRRLATSAHPTSSQPIHSTPTATAAASAAASAAAPELAASVPQPGFFKSDSWTKTVGTIGALANWSIPLAAISHMLSSKDPGSTIDPIMTTSLAIYSLLFMRWAIAISPANYPLMVCHIANEAAQLTQLGRWAMAEKKPDKGKKTDSPVID